MVDLSLPLIIIKVEAIALQGCIRAVTVVVGLGIVTPLIWALLGVVPFFSTG
jgi:hypothetical protein